MSTEIFFSHLNLSIFQICCHPGLIKSMLDADSKATEGLTDEATGDDIDLISQLADMSIGGAEKEVEADVKSVLKMDNPVFKVSRGIVN